MLLNQQHALKDNQTPFFIIKFNVILFFIMLVYIKIKTIPGHQIFCQKSNGERTYIIYLHKTSNEINVCSRLKIKFPFVKPIFSRPVIKILIVCYISWVILPQFFNLFKQIKHKNKLKWKIWFVFFCFLVLIS